MSDLNKSSEIEGSSVQKRRSFLKKSATGAVLVSLPAQSVWGACSVSGAMSGNLSQNTDRHDCTQPRLAGLSPGFWKKYRVGANASKSPIHSKFESVVGGKNSSSANCYKDIVKEVVANEEMNLDAELYSGPEKLNDALVPSSAGFNIAGVWLNSYFGFYGDGADDHEIADQRANEMLLYITFDAIKNQDDPNYEPKYNFEHNNTNYVGSNC